MTDSQVITDIISWLSFKKLWNNPNTFCNKHTHFWWNKWKRCEILANFPWKLTARQKNMPAVVNLEWAEASCADKTVLLQQQLFLSWLIAHLPVQLDMPMLCTYCLLISLSLDNYSGFIFGNQWGPSEPSVFSALCSHTLTYFILLVKLILPYASIKY